MKKLERFAHDVNQNCLDLCRLFAALLKSDLRKLDIPVAENIPDEVVKLRNGDTEFKLFEVIRNLFRELVEQ